MAGQRSASGIFGTQPDAGANADWMAGLCPRLWDVPLQHLAIPGSHDTMTYCLSRKSPVSHTQPRLLRVLNSALPCVTRPVVLKWSATQTLDVTAQLDAGVRYLDLRVAHMRGGPARNLHFVLLSYEDEAAVARRGELWPGVPCWWANRGKPEALIRFLEEKKSGGRPGGLFVAGTNLTESLRRVLAHPAQSLAALTLPALPALSAWVREQRPGPGPACTNIIAGDFIGAGSFVTDVIGLNQKLL
ncbi:PI-PLC X domain-containing protein 1 [Octodon degus]|uniref:PI-PLC X domain-containing protein 1 n=1 Tax=Octodon degus TaxID=10160 RepID=A0A6P6DRC6_OCTDE|nr:PI-PLC X domain-containing protein 1 [Octodon degus]